MNDFRYIRITSSNHAEVARSNENTFLGTIRDTVNGPLDCVNMPDYKCIMYVNDEGHLLNLPINPFATALTGRLIAGDVIIVGTHNDEGVMDGGNYSITIGLLNAVIALQDIMVIRKSAAVYNMQVAK